ncbi:DUF2167 domain-containing protein [Methylocystis sp. IM3]|uniref:DUF2167 domain-containing protein n=1 Tax=unclassified Methylocystis TaxID=2625913 RepID=UPI0030FC3133
MPFPKSPSFASSIALFAALAASAAPGHAREARARSETILEDSAPADAGGSDNVIYVMPPMKPLTGAAAPSKKPGLANKGAQPSESPAPKPAEQKPASSEAATGAAPSKGGGATTVEGEAQANSSAPADLPTIAIDAPVATEQWRAPARAFDRDPIGLQSGPAPSLLPLLDPAAPAQETAAAESAATPETRISALLAEGLVGPVEVRLADRASMWLPAGRVFIPLEAARALAGEVGLQWREGTQGFVAPAGAAPDWLIPVELLDDGHIDAEDARSLDPDKLLSRFRGSLPIVNARRAGAGQPPVALEGWFAPPALDAAGRRLSACVMVATVDTSAPDRFLNCEAWIVGREGAIRIGLVGAVEKADQLKNEIGALAGKIVFDHGKTYEDFDPAADKVAPYRAADLVVRDVSAKPIAARASSAREAAGESLIDRLSGLAYPAFFGLAAVFAYLRLKPRGANDGPSGPGPKRESNETVRPSFFARLAPTLQARLGRGARTQPAARPSGSTQDQPALATLAAKFSRLRPFAPAGNAQKDALAPPANDAEEPVSALRKFAARMRGAQEPPPPAVDPARVLRRRRTGGAAPAFAEDLDASPQFFTEADALQTGAPESEMRLSLSGREDVAPALDRDDFALIEPGDAAASAAINAARARRTDG